MDMIAWSVMLPGMFRPARIKVWRKRRGFTQETLAARVGISTGSMSRIENGKQPYNQPILEAIADALGIAPADLLMPGEPTREDLELHDQIKLLNGHRKRQAVALLRALNEAA